MSNPYAGNSSTSQVLANSILKEQTNPQLSGIATKRYTTRELVSKLFHILIKHPLLLIIAFITTLVFVASSIVIPILVGKIIDSFITISQGSLLSLLLRLVFVIVLGALCQWIASVTTNRISYEAVYVLRIQIFNKLAKLSISSLDSHPHGDLITRISSDVDFIGDGLVQGLGQFISGVATILGTLAVMFYLSPFVCAVVVVLTPLSIVVASLLAKKASYSFSEQQKYAGELGAHVNERISNKRLLTLFDQENESRAIFSQTNQKLHDSGVKAQFISSLANPTTRLVNNIIYAAVAVVSSYCAITGIPSPLSVGQIQSFLSYAHQYMKPFNEISSVTTQIQAALASAERVFSIIDAEEQIPDKQEAQQLMHVDGDICIHNVSFSYTDDKQVLHDININIEKGKRVALVGKTGCGKTTLINVIMRFYELETGTITIDGHDIRSLTRDSLRSKFGMVLQDTWLSTGTVLDNIRYGKPNATEEEVIDAAKRAHALKFILQLPQAFNTKIGEGGVVLSEGQRQLICIARVMLTNPSILLLDEATSSIDTRTELQVQQAFDEIMQNRTSIVIAHRLQTIQNADEILVMDLGSIVERGTHHDLLAKGGFYTKLYKSQFEEA